MPEDKTTEDQTDQPQKKLPIKALIAVVAVLVIEAVAISAVFLLNNQPDAAKADTTAVDEAAAAEKEMEQLLLQDKFQNTRTGRAYLYDTTIYFTVKNKNLATVEDKIEINRARIEADISSIFRKAEPAYLMEFELSTLTRQIKAVLDDRIGTDPVEDKPFITDVIMRMKRFRAD
ncbi:hypothetical protein KS4_12240 [Poriferisphaera corsica]|uniref:Flagellar protein FliL n=1 Tax=Poriferisphaera corsica TaxID=2528020 RepID=A0A517YSG9_9BACT|nr:hypothetical protein [Poriferisphaera corsica]QDU33179.1 hypothetical protein KS4_12240 [Poriferisphaera corsica]